MKLPVSHEILNFIFKLNVTHQTAVVILSDVQILDFILSLLETIEIAKYI